MALAAQGLFVFLFFCEIADLHDAPRQFVAADQEDPLGADFVRIAEDALQLRLAQAELDVASLFPEPCRDPDCGGFFLGPEGIHDVLDVSWRVGPYTFVLQKFGDHRVAKSESDGGDGFAAEGPPERLQLMLSEDRAGEALLKALNLLEDGEAGNLDALGDALSLNIGFANVPSELSSISTELTIKCYLGDLTASVSAFPWVPAERIAR